MTSLTKRTVWFVLALACGARNVTAVGNVGFVLASLASAPSLVPAVVAPAQPAAAVRPRRVALVLFDGAALFEIVGPARILDAVPGFTTYTVASTRTAITTDLATIVPDYTFADAPAPDVILVSSGTGGLRDAALKDWLRTNGPRAEAVVSVCNGALVLANAGLLEGRRATCPSGNFDGLMLLGNDVRPLRGRRFVRDGNVVTCDSWFAGVDGALEVVRFLCGDAAARSAAVRNLYDWSPREPDPDQAATPPTYRVAILKTVLAQGVDAGLADYQKWRATRTREQDGPLDPVHECLQFQILGWTLEGAGRTAEATALCEWTTAAFPKSALAFACLGEAYFESGRFEEALAALIEADQKQAGEPRALEFLAAVLHHPEHVANDDSARARRILRERALESSAALVPAGEPGERMVIGGAVRDAAGRPIPGALVHVFQADASGRYTPTAAMDEPNARLFAFLRTDADGRYAFTTVRPGGYPRPRNDVPPDAGDARWIPQHVHYEVEAPGHAPRRFQLVFRDDPRMTPHWQQWAKDGENPVIELLRDGAGTLRGTCDVTLR